MIRRLSVSYLIVGMLALPGSLVYSADSVKSVATQADLDQAINNAVAREDAARATITTLLQRDEVKGMAAGYGLDVRRAEGAVRTLQGDELQRLSTLAASADLQLAGGDQVLRISLVAALLIVIIVILLTR